MFQKSKCHNHKAINGAHSKREHLDATGIAAVACARHGCFYPAAVCDFQVGER
jgi:Kyakuja-Dileera-Zisupton transposase